MDQVQSTRLPEEIKGWNWGAFLLHGIWGIGNNTLIALLAFVPCAGFVMMFILGIKGNEWAWKNKKWDSVEHFKSVQKKWALAGGIFFVVSILMATGAVFSIFAIMKKSDVYQFSLQQVQNSPDVKDALGEPLKAGFFVSGNINLSGGKGNADISYKVSGPKDAATVYVQANKEAGRWVYEYIYVDRTSDNARLKLTPSLSE